MARKPITPIVRRPKKVVRRAGMIMAMGLVLPQAEVSVSRNIPIGRTVTATVTIAATVNRAIPIGRTISVAGASLPGKFNRTTIVRRKKVPKRQSVVQVQGVSSPPTTLVAFVNRPIAIGRTITASAIDGVLPGAGALIVQRPHPPKRKRRPIVKQAPIGTPVVGSSATLNRVIAIGRSASATVQIDGTVNRAIPIGRLATAKVALSASLARVIAIGRSISATAGQAPPAPGTPTSGVVLDSGVRSGIVTDAGDRSGLVSDNGHRSGIVLNTT